MRLPYLQLSQKFITAQSVFIAALLKVPRQHVVGMGTDLFAFAIEKTSTETKPPDGRFCDPDAVVVLEAAAGWGGETGRMVDAFIRADVIERNDDGCLRVKGCDRYKSTWAKNSRRKGLASHDHTTGEKPENWAPVEQLNRAVERKNRTVEQLNRAADVDVDVDVEKKHSPSVSGAQQELLATPGAPEKKKPRPTSAQAEFVDWMAQERGKALPSTAPPDVKPNWAMHGPRIAEMLREHGRRLAEEAYRLFLVDGYALANGDPPCPLPLFVSQWPKWVSTAQKRTTGPPRSIPDVRKGVVRAEDMKHSPEVGIDKDF